MILVHHTFNGLKRVTDLKDVYKANTALLMGGAPTIKEQPLSLLEQRGVLAMAINNAAIHFRPSLWVCGDHPECYEPQILFDPSITKFMPLPFAEIPINGRACKDMPNIHFYVQEDNVPWEQFLHSKFNVPWYCNTLFVGIHILYELGVRRIILGGSDFGFGSQVYAHESSLGTLEQKWNHDLYESLMRELKLLKPIFEASGLSLLDCSKNSRLSDVYKHITMEEAVALCLESFPKKMVDPKTLPHCSKFAPGSIKERIAKWPGHNGEYEGYFAAQTQAQSRAMQSLI